MGQEIREFYWRIWCGGDGGALGRRLW
jgi:hypothetical protein